MMGFCAIYENSDRMADRKMALIFLATQSNAIFFHNLM